VQGYILTDNVKKGVIVDPGGDTNILIDYISCNSIKLEAIILTHCYYDYILSVEELQAEYNLPV
jgi:glyoxylase-like metal-dependent hydrolase (beta-lactamase superfamily II)